MNVGRILAVIASGWLALPSSAWAGPIELLGTIEVPSQKPDRIVARWYNGDGGLYVSDDRGATFRMTCYGGAGPALRDRDVEGFIVAADGGVCVGTVRAVYCSNDEVCGWKEATELSGQYVADFAQDPVDPNRLYLVTGTSMGMNGVYVRETPQAMWKPLGTHLPGFFSRVRVTKNGGAKRFFVSSQETTMEAGMDGGPPAYVLRYYVRYSDDDAKTWTSNYVGEVPDRGQFRLLAVDPTNPDRVVVGHLRELEMAPDDLFYSDKRGEEGSFVKIGSVISLGQAIFLPDGTLFYGDNNQDTPGLFKVAKLGDAPVKLSGDYKVGCLHFDAATDRLYVCNDWKLGTANRDTGELSMLMDMRESSTLYECEGEPAMKETCAVTFNPPNFCDPTHYPMSPVCVTHFGTGPGGSAGAAAAGASGGAAGSLAAGTGGAAGGAPSEGGSSAAGTAAPAGAGGGKTPSDGGGCSCSAVGGADDALGTLGLGLGLAGLALWRRKRGRRLSSQ